MEAFVNDLFSLMKQTTWCGWCVGLRLNYGTTPLYTAPCRPMVPVAQYTANQTRNTSEGVPLLFSGLSYVLVIAAVHNTRLSAIQGWPKQWATLHITEGLCSNRAKASLRTMRCINSVFSLRWRVNSLFVFYSFIPWLSALCAMWLNLFNAHYQHWKSTSFFTKFVSTNGW